MNVLLGVLLVSNIVVPLLAFVGCSIWLFTTFLFGPWDRSRGAVRGLFLPSLASLSAWLGVSAAMLLIMFLVLMMEFGGHQASKSIYPGYRVFHGLLDATYLWAAWRFCRYRQHVLGSPSNNALQPTDSSVTPPAEQASRQPAGG